MRIYTEKNFPGKKKIPDIIIVKIREDYAEDSLYLSIREEDAIALLELKMKSDVALSTERWRQDGLMESWNVKSIYISNTKISNNWYEIH